MANKGIFKKRSLSEKIRWKKVGQKILQLRKSFSSPWQGRRKFFDREHHPKEAQ